MKIKISKKLTTELVYMFDDLLDNVVLMDEYGVTEDEIMDLISNLRTNKGEWDIPHHLVKMVKSECENRADVLMSMMTSALEEGNVVEAKKEGKLIKEIDSLFV
jgi:hypothetical protein